MSDPLDPDFTAFATSAWLMHVPRAAEHFDKATFERVTEALCDVILPEHKAGRHVEIASALVKAFAVSTCHTVLHGSDHDVSDLSEWIRREVYSEVMAARRAIIQDASRSDDNGA